MQDLTLLGQTVGELLKTHSHTIAVAESSAGGLISAALLTVPGASAYFLGGGVIYTHEARRSLLAMPDEALEGIRASTEGICAAACPSGAGAFRDHLGAE